MLTAQKPHEVILQLLAPNSPLIYPEGLNVWQRGDYLRDFLRPFGVKMLDVLVEFQKEQPELAILSYGNKPDDPNTLNKAGRPVSMLSDRGVLIGGPQDVVDACIAHVRAAFAQGDLVSEIEVFENGRAHSAAPDIRANGTSMPADKSLHLTQG